ncbi:DNA invertase Pin-like site-specific DNA recombinase [Staphylococcus saprophyticus]
MNKGSFNRFKIKFCYNNERNLILERSSAGRIAARARERYGGRPEKLNKLT